MHTLGGVQPTAPHGTPGYHCADDFDRMCGDDGSGTQMRYLCPLSHENALRLQPRRLLLHQPRPRQLAGDPLERGRQRLPGPGRQSPPHPAMTWGYDAYGQLGDGAAADRPSPVAVGLTGVDAVGRGRLPLPRRRRRAGVVLGPGPPRPARAAVAGRRLDVPGSCPGCRTWWRCRRACFHSLALKSDGTVWAWGWNAYGQLGDGTTVDRWQPVQVAGPHRGDGRSRPASPTAWPAPPTGRCGRGAATASASWAGPARRWWPAGWPASAPA